MRTGLLLLTLTAAACGKHDDAPATPSAKPVAAPLAGIAATVMISDLHCSITVPSTEYAASPVEHTAATVDEVRLAKDGAWNALVGVVKVERFKNTNYDTLVHGRLDELGSDSKLLGKGTFAGSKGEWSLYEDKTTRTNDDGKAVEATIQIGLSSLQAKDDVLLCSVSSFDAPPPAALIHACETLTAD
jgi:hypothetical protein